MKRILLLGDWVVDDNWVTGIHRSSTASRIGPSHFRSLHNKESTVQGFCGAGQTASLLCLAKDENSDPLFEIVV